MTEPALRKQCSSKVDFGFMRGYVPEKPTMIASDIDMIIERRGYFLVAEWKHENEAPMPVGQERLLNALAKGNRFTVLIVTYVGTQLNPVVKHVDMIYPDGKASWLPIHNNDEFKAYLSQWVKVAESMRGRK